MSKLTLSIDAATIERAKHAAAARQTSVSHLVEQFLGLLGRTEEKAEATPVLQKLRGSLAHARSDSDRKDFRKHLSKKYA